MTVYHQNSPLGQFIAYLDPTTCRCRDDKYRGTPFCVECYKALPDDLKLFLRCFTDDESRMEAFDNAKAYLESSGL